VCRAGFGRLRYTGKSNSTAGFDRQQARAGTAAAQHPRNRTCDTLLPEHRGPRMGYAGRNSETEPTPTSSCSGLHNRGSKGRSVTVDCCSSDLSVPDGKQGTIFARGTSVSSPFRVYDARKTWVREWDSLLLVCMSLAVFECSNGSRRLGAGRLTRSSSAYVPSARQAGPHAHPL
jgi:hypothetical protein